MGWVFLSTIDSQLSSALDFGTGSGCIAIAMAVKCPAARVVALDVSAETLAVAKQNAERNSVVKRIEFRCGDGFAALRAGERFDLIVSNPPYIPSAEIESLQPEVRDFDPRVALDGGADGLDFYRMLAAQAGNFLKPDGRIMLEFGDGQADGIRQIFEAQKWIVEAVREDYTRRQRIIVAGRN
jgi:release factor glutamine methyltransferase